MPRNVEYYPSIGVYSIFVVEGKEYQVLPEKELLNKGFSQYDVCQHCKDGFHGYCPQFTYPDDVKACAGTDRRDGEDVYFEHDKEKFHNVKNN